MKEEELLNIIQPVFRGIVLSMLVIAPDKIRHISQSLLGVSATPSLDERSRRMLVDLSQCLEKIADAETPKH